MSESATPPPGGLRVLLIEDDPETSTIYSEYLISHGYDVLVTASAVEGIGLAGRKGPALIMMDLSLPGMDGPTAIRLLKADAATSGIPILAMTASSLETDRRRACDAGCDAFMAKPCRPPKLLEQVQLMLAGVSSRWRIRRGGRNRR